jgi:biopolymer transport protein ExbD
MLGARTPRALKRSGEEDADVDVVPIMNVFLVIVLLLLMSFSFFNLRAINTSVPVLANSDAPNGPASEIKLTVVVEIEEKGLKLSALSDDAGQDVLSKIAAYLPKDSGQDYPYGKLTSQLQGIKAQYPKSDTAIIIPEGSIVYDKIIQTMDAARYADNVQLFPRVVISGKVG